MPVPSSLADWSATESQNYPAAGDTAGGVIDDIARQIQATTRRYLASFGTSQAASALNLATADGKVIQVTGSGSSISSLGTVSAGMTFVLRFAGANTLVHSSNLVLPGATNILTAANDTVEFTSAGSGVWWCTDYQSGASSIGGVAVGTIHPYLGTAAPSGYLLCYGQAVSRSTYAGLFAVTSTTYGAGDGTTTFNLPDLRGRVMVGKDDMGGTAAGRVTSASGGVAGATLGAVGGLQAVTLTESTMPAHVHTQQGTFTSAANSANHAHAFSGFTEFESANHTHSEVLLYDSGLKADLGSQATIYYPTGGNTGGTSNNHQHQYQGTTGNQTANHFHQTTLSGAVTSTGGSNAHVNMQPSIIVNWIVRV